MARPQYRPRSASAYAQDATSAGRKAEARDMTEILDSAMGFDRFDQGSPRVGWLVNFQPVTVDCNEHAAGASGVDFYFLDEEGGYFKTTLLMDPYILIKCVPGTETDVEEWTRKSLEGIVKNTHIIEKEDLDIANHLTGKRQTLLELRFWNTADMNTAKKQLMPLAARNQAHMEAFAGQTDSLERQEPSSYIIDVREHDVPYHVRVAIDKNVRVGKWYRVEVSQGRVSSLNELADRIARADPVVMAFDIETCKAPLKFPDATVDPIMMISYMIDGVGFLITNREVVAEDIDDFEYTPKPEFHGEFTIFNEPGERELLLRFIEHIREEKPTLLVTYNGDFFDWPYVDARCAIHGISLYEQTGFRPDSEGEYKSAHAAHMDALRWVKRDSYLPQGSQGLKPVTKAKLGYNPLEISPELMTPYARERPQVLAEYSVSDAVATYYLYMKYVHPFIFSLCNILPLRPDEVLRKGTGTLCEMLLMVQAYDRGILLPHKHTDPPERFYNGHLVESETYVGGHVESLEAGVFRSDLPTHFNIDSEAVDELLEQLDDALKFTIIKEQNAKIEDCTNYDEIKEEITEKLLALKAQPSRTECPLIYHVDVASMYPNIMTTNRLQPDSMKSEKDCALCDFNRVGKVCDRRLPWAWRGEYYPPKKDEFLMIQRQLQTEQFDSRATGGAQGGADGPNRGGYRNGGTAMPSKRKWDELSPTEKAALTKKRISDYSRKVYHKIKDSETIEREAIICQRENPFYVNTVRDFRDRRYEFKGLQKQWKRKLEEIPASDAASREEAAKMIVLYDSLQLAHKCILNSFYGYVMRKGSRWYSMEMAGVTCLMGATIIQLARSLVERLGRPLELDTDGIWCILPSSFPGDLAFKYKNGKKGPFAYPCTMLNHLVHKQFTNHQYQTLINADTFEYEVSSDNSIFFEVDGPYRAMMLPSSREEGKGLKKRYAVFNFDGSLAELKGFEIKRRGELQLIKSFQEQVFWRFLDGATLEQCYDAVAHCANAWLDVIDSAGASLEDADLMSLISENKSMSKSLEEYGNQKSTSICTAQRLCEFLGPQIVKDRGLNCQYIVSREPAHEPVTNRAIPVAIFGAEPSVKSYFLRKWLKQPGMDNFDPRQIIDWAYYRERLEATIQKIVTIPAARQGVANPVPRVIPPAWLVRRLAEQADKKKQRKIGFSTVSRESHLASVAKAAADSGIGDIEDAMNKASTPRPPHAVVTKRRKPETDTTVATDAEALAVPDVAPDPDESYADWLMYMKRVWSKQRVQRESRRRAFGDHAAPRFNRGVQGLIRDQVQSAFRNGGAWEVLQFSDGKQIGQVLAAMWINGRAQHIAINVPRRVFVEARGVLQNSESDIIIEQCDWTLPNGNQNKLFTVTMSEQRYQDELLRADGLFKRHDVVAVHEQQLSPVDRVLIELGSRVTLADTPGILGRGLSSGFDLEWLKPLSNKARKTAAKYLDHVSLDYVFVQHFEVHGRHICAISASAEDSVHVVQYSPSELEPWNSIAAEYAAQLESHKPEQPLFSLPANVEINQHAATDLKRFYAQIGTVVANLQSATKAVVVVQSDRPTRRLLSRVRQLSELSVVTLPKVQTRGSPLPAVGWQPGLARKIAKNILRLQYWLAEQQSRAQYADMPLGNLPSGDDMRSFVDVLYARRLHQARHVLWWRASPQTEASYNTNAADTSNVVTSNKGLYSNICLDISVGNLAINTVLTASLLTAAEGTEDTDAPDALVVDAFSGVAWRVLSQLVKEWWNEAAASNEIADRLVEQFGGWVVTPSAALHSPRLAYRVANLSSKAVGQLVGEFKRAQMSVVLASPSRIIVATSKWQVEAAFPFASYIIKNIKSNPLFTYLDISVSDYWDYLAWLDSANFCGRVWKEMLPNDAAAFTHVSNWQIAEFLSPLLHSEFDEWVYQLIQAVSEAKDKYFGSAGDAPRPTQLGPAITPANTPPKDGEDDSADQTASFVTGVLSYLETPLANRVRKLYNRYVDSRADPHSELAAEFIVPTRAGSVTKPTNPVLEFVNTLCAVYGLDKAIEPEFIKLKRRLLGVLKVGEFGLAAQYVNPSAKLIVADVICGACNDCISVDVCRPAKDGVFSFECPRCGNELDRVLLEERLVQMFLELIMRYQLQDLRCAKCNSVRPDNLSRFCVCSGQWVTTIPAIDVSRQATVYGHIAEHFNLRLLQSAHTSLAVTSV